MKLIYITQHFSSKSGLTRPYEISKHLKKLGWEILVVCGENKDDVTDIVVKTTRTKYNQKYGFVKRVLSFVHYMLKSILLALKEKDVDAVYASSPPITVGIAGALVAKMKHRSFIFEVRDVWPDAPIQLGFIQNRILQKIMIRIERWLYKAADQIIVLSPAMEKNLVKKGVDVKKIKVISNFAHLDRFRKWGGLDARKQVEKQYPELEEKCICLYPGTFGFANNLDFILDVATTFYNPNIAYVLIGDGKEKENLVKRVKKENIQNVFILDGVSKESVYAWIAACDVGMVILGDYPVLHENSSNKFFDYLAAGKPVILNFEGWQSQLLAEYKAGFGVRAEHKEAFYEILKSLQEDLEQRKQMGKNAKTLAQQFFERNQLLNQLEGVLTHQVGKGKGK
ncbi:glycosyltransferase family 4 protein [Listeria aquatica]|uniref:Glycosyltransferase family 4 protein n=2 Tax=Listeria aquatica TaxID=1494960 RepID=A0A841ZQ59_9LIST|nr:glycosyltransferase family 4 protein [Listeria aquatica]MBC1522323.1 glycosyltransferase family 4 protein [Listeria aquatica]